MTSPQVNVALEHLDSKGWIDGTITINENAPPTIEYDVEGQIVSNGIAAKANLQARGWTVTTD